MIAMEIVKVICELIVTASGVVYLFAAVGAKDPQVRIGRGVIAIAYFSILIAAN